MKNSVIVFGFIFVFLPGCATHPNSSRREISSAKTESAAPALPAYTILTQRDESMPDRKRLFFSIFAPEAKSFGDRGKVVVAAARELQRNYQADVIEVWLEPNDNTQGLGLVLAMATYSPDGKGMSGIEHDEVWDNSASYGLSTQRTRAKYDETNQTRRHQRRASENH